MDKKQKKVMDELFEGQDEKEVLENNKISRFVFERWVNEPEWIAEFDRRVDAARRQSQIIITMFQPAAATKLVGLMNCDKEQTARQACLDIINMPRIVPEGKITDTEQAEALLPVSEETARELIEVLAKEVKKSENDRSNKRS